MPISSVPHKPASRQRCFGMVVGGCLSLLMLAVVVTGASLGFDERLLIDVRGAVTAGFGEDPVRLTAVARDLSALGSITVIVLLTCLAAGWFAAAGHFRRAMLLVVALLGTCLLNEALKVGIARERPHVVSRWADETSFSFPSGHAMLSATLYPLLGALLAQGIPSRFGRAAVVGAAVGLSLAVGLTRIYFGVHYPTDVLAGWIIGLTWAGFCWAWLSGPEPARDQEAG